VGERRKKAQRHGRQAPHHRPEARPANARLSPTREDVATIIPDLKIETWYTRHVLYFTRKVN
jgi:hypothetical protein